MKKCSALILLTCALALLTAERVEAAPVTWDFIATSCVTEQPSATGCDPRQQYPALLATLTLTGPDSSGSAVWGPPPINGEGPPVFTGDGFSLDFSSRYRPLTSTFAGNPTPFGECETPREICGFDLSWSESAGQLDALSIIVNGFSDSLGEVGAGGSFGLSGGLIGTDDTYFGAVQFGPGGVPVTDPFSGCSQGVCDISGIWAADVSLVSSLVTAPEPGSLALLASAFGVWGLIGRWGSKRMQPRGPKDCTEISPDTRILMGEHHDLQASIRHLPSHRGVGGHNPSHRRVAAGSYCILLEPTADNMAMPSRRA